MTADRRKLAWWGLAVLIIGVALAARIAFIAATPGFRPFADAADYDRVAVSLARHGDYPPSAIAPNGGPSGFRPPAYPYLLSVVYRLTGTTNSTDRFTVARALSALLSLLVVALAGGLAALLWGRIAAFVAMALAAVYPPLVTIGVAMLAEPLFTVLALAAVTSVLMARRSDGRLRWAVLAGMLGGLAALTRTNGVVLLVALVVGLWPTRRVALRSLTPVLAMVVSLTVVIAPWCIRDVAVFHRFVPITDQTGFTLAGTYNSVSEANRASPGAWRVPVMAPYSKLLRRGPNEAQLGAAFQSAALRYAVHHPLYVAEVGYYNLGRLLGLQGPSTEIPAARESGISNWVSNVDVYSSYLLLLAAIIAMLAGALRTVSIVVWLAPALIALSLIFVIAYMRYRLPIDAFLVVLTSYLAGRHAPVFERLRVGRPSAAAR